MKKRSASDLAVCVFLCMIGLFGPNEAISQSSKTLRITEISLRSLAIKTEMPGFPEDSRKRGARGVSVAELDLDEQGNVADVRVIEAPDESIKAAVLDAVRRWKFRPSTVNGEPIRIRSKLTFYYVNKKGKARVKNPRSVGR